MTDTGATNDRYRSHKRQTHWCHERQILELLPGSRTTKPILDEPLEKQILLEPAAGATSDKNRYWRLEPQTTNPILETGATNDRQYWRLEP